MYLIIFVVTLSRLLYFLEVARTSRQIRFIFCFIFKSVICKGCSNMTLSKKKVRLFKDKYIVQIFMYST